MNIGIIGTKSGMTRVFDESGESVPVTVVSVAPNRVTQIKNQERDAYQAVQVTWGERNEKHVSQPMTGHFSKANTSPGRGVCELRARTEDARQELSSVELGTELDVGQFFAGQYVDVSGVSKGKGFAGTVKRWNFHTQDNTHGNSLSHRAPGSIGQCQTPGKVYKGKKMAGHLGNVRVTVQNLRVVRVDAERNVILIKGAIPGANGGDVIVRPAVKAGTQTPPTDSQED